MFQVFSHSSINKSLSTIITSDFNTVDASHNLYVKACGIYD